MTNSIEEKTQKKGNINNSFIKNKITKNNNLTKSFFENMFSRKDTILLSVLTFILSTILYFGTIKNGNSPAGFSIFLLEGIFIFILIKFSGLKNNLEKRSELSFSIFLVLFISSWFIFFTNSFFSTSFIILINIINLFLIFRIKEPKFKLFSSFYNYYFNFFNYIGSSFGGMFYSLKELQKSYFGNSGIIKNNKSNIKNVLIGFGILSILLFIILPLLASADKIFSNFLDKVLNKVGKYSDFGNLLNFNSIGDFISIFIIFSLLFSLFLFRPVLNVQIEKSKKKDHKLINNLIYSIIIYGLNFVYFIFILIQFRYIFFGNQDLFANLDITYASYIHQGFYQLMIVSLINFLIYKYFYKRVKKEKKSEKSKLALLLFFTIIISYSALSRIFLYIDAYNLTILRFFVVYISLIIIILFSTNIYILFTNNKKLNKIFNYFILITFIGIGFLNIESFVAKYNIDNYNKSISKHLDREYILNLGYDAIDEKLKISSKEVKIIKTNKSLIRKILNYNHYYNLGDLKFEQPKNEFKFEKIEKLKIEKNFYEINSIELPKD